MLECIELYEGETESYMLSPRHQDLAQWLHAGCPVPSPFPCCPLLLQNEVMAGDLVQEDYEAGSEWERAQKAKLAAIENERARMAEERASLPIYAHRWGPAGAALTGHAATCVGGRWWCWCV